MVTSYFPGRIRLRAEVFKDSVIVERCLAILKQSDAVKNVENNLRTGSVLLEYDEERVPMDKLKPLKPFFEKLRSVAIVYTSKKQKEILDMLDEFDAIVKTW